MKTPVTAELVELSDSRYSLRVLATVLFGLVVSGFLTWFMYILIESSHQELDETVRANLLDFVRVQREEVSQRKQVKPPRPEMDEAPPAPPTPQADQQNMADAGIQVSIPSGADSVSVDVGGVGIGMGDGEYLPIVKIAPAYPYNALSQGKEGSCTVEYTVTETGATKDIHVVQGECIMIFARASIDAAKKFKYKPRVIDGDPIEVPNVRNRFDFTLSNAGDK